MLTPPSSDSCPSSSSTEVNDRCGNRDNFNLAHEMGHIVMHRGISHTPGTRTVENQAHRFAGAFLAPAKALRKAFAPATLTGAATSN